MNVKHTLVAVLLTSLLTGCFTRRQPEIDTTNMSQLAAISAENVPSDFSNDQMNQLRNKAMSETAMSLGAQGGLAWESEQINLSLEKDKKHLETIFNFNGMMLSHGVLPPILVEGDNSLNLADRDTIRIADKTYKIIEQARFATTPPNWREYLHMTFSKPPLPNKVLLPKTKEERAAWARGIAQGWEKGVQQANSIFQQDLARLKRDYRGMILYRKLLQQHMISPPFVAKTELGVTGNGDTMRINDQVLRITALPRLQTNSDGWKAVVIRQDD